MEELKYLGEIFKRVVPDTPLEWTGERLTTATAGQVEIEHLHRYFLARALCRGRDVLDVASGEGYGAALLAQTALSVIGVEVSAEAVAHAAEAYRQPNLRFLAGDARHLPLDDASVDTVVSFETIEHLYEHDQFLAEVRRVLRPGGRFIISSPERDTYSPSGSSANPYHVRELTTAEFSALLRDSFAHVRLLGQRPMLGSVLLSEGDVASQSLTFEKRGSGHFEAACGLPRPVYLVAVASDQPVADVPDSLYIETAEIGTVIAAASAADAVTAELTALRARVSTAEKAEAEARAAVEKAEAERRTKAVEYAEAARAEIAAARAEAEARGRAERAEARAVVEKAEAERRTKAVEDAEAARAEVAAAHAEAAAACSQRDIACMAARRAAEARAVAEKAEAEARARAETAEAEMRTKAVEDAASARAEIAAAHAEAAAACSQRDIARMAARRAAAAAEGHWRGRIAEANAELQQARDRADAARTETARMLSATQQLQLERTRYESEIASLRREIQAIFDSTIWRACGTATNGRQLAPVGSQASRTRRPEGNLLGAHSVSNASTDPFPSEAVRSMTGGRPL